MRVIITGGTGLIGRALTDSLAADGHEVIILSRAPERAAGLPAGARAVGWDARTADGWGGLADGADAIVNLAGASIGGEGMLELVTQPWTPARKRLIRDSRVHAGQAVMRAIEQAAVKPRVLVQASAVGYYGLRGDDELTEDTPAGPGFQAQVCLDWEGATAGADALGVRRAVIRTAGVAMSTRGGALPFMLLPFKLFAGGPLGSGRQWFAWIHLQDQVRAIRFLIENDQASGAAVHGAFNVCAPNPVRNAELARTLGRVMHRPAFVPAPAFAIKLLLGEKSTLVLDGQRQVPKRLLELGFQFKFPSVQAALEDLLK